MKTMPRAVIYCRVSTEQQAEAGTSLATQELICLRKAGEIGAQVIQTYRDEGVSGAYYLTRPGIQAALADIEDQRADTLIIAKLDRSGRDVEIVRDIRRRVEDAGARLLFCDGLNFENNAAGRLAFNTLAGFAEFEKDMIRERTAAGRLSRAKEGKQPQRALAPYGYRIVKKEDVIRGSYPAEAIGTYVVFEPEAKRAREILKRYANGESMNRICQSLQSEGVPTPKGGKRWSPNTLACLMDNSVYMGKAVFGKQLAKMDEGRIAKGLNPRYKVRRCEADHTYLPAPALVSEEVWLECQRRRRDNKSALGGNAKRKHLLSSLLRCPTCGNRLVHAGKTSSRPYRYYHCKFHAPSQSADGHVCNSRNYRADIADSLILKTIRELAASPELITTALQAYEAERLGADEVNEIPPMRQELASLKRREGAIVDAQIEARLEGTDSTVYAVRLSETRTQIAALERSLKLSRQPQARPQKGDQEVYAAVITAVEDALLGSELTDAEKSHILGTIVERIVPLDELHAYSIYLRGEQTLQSVVISLG